MQVQHYINPSKNEIKELDNSYKKRKMEIFFLKVLWHWCVLQTYKETTQSCLMLHHYGLSVFSMNTAITTFWSPLPEIYKLSEKEEKTKQMEMS